MQVTSVTKLPRVVAHRGISIYKAPENTPYALRKALASGFDIETDAQWANGKVILYHDDYIPGPNDSNLNGGGFYLPKERKLVYDCAEEDLKSVLFDKEKLESHLSCQAREPIRLTLEEEPRIATLDDLLPIPENCKVYIELKRPNNDTSFDDDLERMVLHWIKQNNLLGKVVIISFNLNSLRKARELDTQVEIGVDAKGRTAKDLQQIKKLIDEIRITSWHPPIKQTSKRLIEKVHSLGISISPWVWSESKQEELGKILFLVQAGVDGIITNQAENIRELL